MDFTLPQRILAGEQPSVADFETYALGLRVAKIPLSKYDELQRDIGIVNSYLAKSGTGLMLRITFAGSSASRLRARVFPTSKRDRG